MVEPSPSGLTLVNQLVVGTAIESSKRRVDAQIKTLSEGLGRVGIGMVLIDGAKTVLCANAPAVRILDEEMTFCLKRGRLAGISADAVLALERIEAALGEGFMIDVALRGGPRLFARGISKALLPSGVPAAIVMFLEHEMGVADDGQSVRRVCRMFDLTAAETRLALALADGHSPASAARTFGVSAHTTHSQLSAVFRKTGARRQPDLIRLLLTHGERAERGSPTGRPRSSA